MRHSLFERRQSVLLIGEGNFSFSVELVKLDLSLHLTSSCFDKHPTYSFADKNISFLKNKGARVLLGIDATRLNEYEEFKGHTFDRIVFNFPHVGGKSKIQLNRELLRCFFTSCAPLLSPEGAVIVSLCQGQGGSSHELVSREPANTWKIVEMAAHGNLVLTAVEPWILNSQLGGYSCIGRRSLDSTFHREGALVHVFRFAPRTFTFHDTEKHLEVVLPHYVQLPEGTVQCSHLESVLLKKNLLSGNTSTLYHLLQHFNIFCIRKNLQTKVSKMSTVMENGSLRSYKELTSFIKHFKNRDLPYLLLLWGIAFNDLDCDFTSYPASCYLALLGYNSYTVCEEWLIELGCSNEALSDVVWKCDAYTSLLHLDKVAVQLFQLSGWHELWASHAHIFMDENQKLAWKPASISPPKFTFDLSVASENPPAVKAICEVLWQLVGEIVQHVEVVDTYISSEGWHSKCFRLTYCSYEIALHRSWVLKLQRNVIGPVLESHLQVTIR